jgi:archaellum component FlaC
LERKKIENEIREKVKQLSAEKERWRGLSEQVEQKKMEVARMEAQVCEASTEINFIMGKNNEIIEVNNQLNDDLKVCQRHSENVCRVNKNM